MIEAAVPAAPACWAAPLRFINGTPSPVGCCLTNLPMPMVAQFGVSLYAATRFATGDPPWDWEPPGEVSFGSRFSGGTSADVGGCGFRRNM